MRRSLLLAVLLASLVCRAAEVPPSLTPVFKSEQNAEFDAATGDSVTKGTSSVELGTFLLTADGEMRYNVANQILVARGNAQLTVGTRRLLADVITYDYKRGTFAIEDVRFGEHPLYVSAASASGTLTELTLHHAIATFNEPGPFAPTLRADKLIYTNDGRKTLRAEGVRLGVGKVLPLSLPKFEQALDQPLISYLTLRGGYRASLGAHVEMGVHAPLTPTVRLGGEIGLYSQRGIMFGPSGRYSDRDRARLNGYFRSGYINDHGDRREDLLGRPVPEERGYVEWRHWQQLDERVTFAAQLNYWSDSEILRDFRPDDFFPLQQPDTFVESVYRGSNYFISLFARFQPNEFHRVQERLPEVRFDLLPISLGHGFYERFNASAAVLRDDPPEGGPILRSDRLDAYYALTRPFTPREWFSFTPVAGGRVTHYANISNTSAAGNVRENYTRVLGELGFDAELRASAVHAYKNNRWKIDGLRHLVTPKLSYRYVPQGERGRRYIPQIDRRVFSTYLPPLGLGATRNLDDLHELNTFRFGVDNTLQTRDATYGSRDLLRFNVAADFRVDRQPGERDWSEVHAELAFMPAPWLEFDLYQSFVPQTFTLRELNTGVTIRDGDAWSIRFSNHFLRREIEEFVIDGSVRLNEVYDVRARVHYDARERRFVEQSFGIRQNVRNTWLIEYIVTLHDGRRRESDFGFDVQLGLVGF